MAGSAIPLGKRKEDNIFALNNIRRCMFPAHKDIILIDNGRYTSGFTLIEAVMVVVILGILYFAAQPRFDTFYNLKLKTAAKKLISDIRYTQSLAVSRHDDYAIYFDVDGENYRVYRVSDGKLAKDPFTNTDLIVDFTTDSEYRGINIYKVNFSGGDILRFNWRGVPQDKKGNDLTKRGVVWLRYRSWSLEVDVTPHTGRVSWQ